APKAAGGALPGHRLRARIPQVEGRALRRRAGPRDRSRSLQARRDVSGPHRRGAPAVAAPLSLATAPVRVRAAAAAHRSAGRRPVDAVVHRARRAAGTPSRLMAARPRAVRARAPALLAVPVTRGRSRLPAAVPSFFGCPEPISPGPTSGPFATPRPRGSCFTGETST